VWNSVSPVLAGALEHGGLGKAADYLVLDNSRIKPSVGADPNAVERDVHQGHSLTSHRDGPDPPRRIRVRSGLILGGPGR
jgi:hypothetical protein